MVQVASKKLSPSSKFINLLISVLIDDFLCFKRELLMRMNPFSAFRGETIKRGVLLTSHQKLSDSDINGSMTLETTP